MSYSASACRKQAGEICRYGRQRTTAPLFNRKLRVEKPLLRRKGPGSRAESRDSGLRGAPGELPPGPAGPGDPHDGDLYPQLPANPAPDGRDGSVDRFTNTLRSKVGPDRKRATFVKTIHIGYQFEARVVITLLLVAG